MPQEVVSELAEVALPKQWSQGLWILSHFQASSGSPFPPGLPLSFSDR